MNIPELSKISISADGRTDPYVPSGTEIVLIQKGTVEVGRLFYIPDTFDTYIDHPLNNLELSQNVLEIIKLKRPEFLKSDNAVILTCPEEIKKEMIWKD
jgi:hypothetical protein